MKVLIVGDAAVQTGFARCTHALADELHKRGHDVAVLGINYWGDPHRYPYAIFPCFNPTDGSRDQFGTTRLPKLVHRFSPDVVVIINDPWNIAAYFEELDNQLEEGYELPKMIGWLAVDSKNQRDTIGALNRLDHIVVWTEFARSEIRAVSTSRLSVVPLGIDAGKFMAVNKAEARELVLPAGEAKDDLFIVGVVGRNQYRKRLDITLESFSQMLEGLTPEAAHRCRLFLHTAPTGDSGFDLIALSEYYGIRDKVLISKPRVSKGIDESHLKYLYSSFDVYLSTSQGEGWGLPAQEAMACRVPCVLPDWAAFGIYTGWVCSHHAKHVPVSTNLVTAPVNSSMYTIGAVPSPADVADALISVYCGDEPDVWEAKELAQSLTLDLTGQRMADVVESVVK